MYNLYKNIFTRQFLLVFLLVFILGLHAHWLMAQEPIPSPIAATSSEASISAPPTEAVSNATSGEKTIFASSFDRDNALLALALPNEVRWLETPQDKIIALFKARETRKSLGSLLILHAPELPQLWPAPLESLRRNLPLYGWDTMAVPLPSLQATKISGSPESVDSNRSSESTNMDSSSIQTSSAATQGITPLLRTQLINERINAAIKLLNKIGQPNVVVLVDNSSAPDSVVELYKTTIQALILVNLQNQEPLTQIQLAAIFSNIDLPVLEVFFRPDDKYQIEMRRLHQAEAMRKNLKNYQQLILPPENFTAVDNKQSFWLEKVRGFIKKSAKPVLSK